MTLSVQSLPNLITIPELAKELGISANFLYQRSRFGKIPGLRRIGRFVRIERSEFYRALEAGELKALTSVDDLGECD